MKVYDGALTLALCEGVGLPPSWARETGAEQKLPQKLRDQFGDDLQAAGMKTWRRKFLWFPGDHSLRPPFYGSFSRVRCGFVSTL